MVGHWKWLSLEKGGLRIFNFCFLISSFLINVKLTFYFLRCGVNLGIFGVIGERGNGFFKEVLGYLNE